MCSIFARADGSATESQFPSQLTTPHYDPRTFRQLPLPPHRRKRRSPAPSSSESIGPPSSVKKRRRRRKKKREVGQGRRKRESPKKGVLSEIKSSSTGVTRGLRSSRVHPCRYVASRLRKAAPPRPPHPSLFLSLFHRPRRLRVPAPFFCSSALVRSLASSVAPRRRTKIYIAFR